MGKGEIEGEDVRREGGEGGEKGQESRGKKGEGRREEVREGEE